jgi:NDP-sugar pyrophosphorylase family protein
MEKPSLDYYVSMGIYVLEPEALDVIPDNEAFDLPDLIKALLDQGKKVKGFAFEGYWQDIGRPEDYEKAQKDYETLKLY